MIAWGGVWAQGVVYALTRLYLFLNGGAHSYTELLVSDAFLGTNTWLMIINLLPIHPLDGSRAWSLFPLLWQRMRKPAAYNPGVFIRDVPVGPYAQKGVDLSVVVEDTDEDEDRKKREKKANEQRFQKMVDQINEATQDPHFGKEEEEK